MLLKSCLFQARKPFPVIPKNITNNFLANDTHRKVT